MKYIVTGGSGFVGTALIKKILKNKKNIILNIDNLTYASNKDVFKSSYKNRYFFKKINIINQPKIEKILKDFKPSIIFNLAAESHVDNSISFPLKFIKTNIIGTYSLLQSSLNYYKNLNNVNKKKFKLIHISTDEVYGSLNEKEKSFTENSLFKPNSPYSASKASSEHFVRSWNKTFNLPVIITNCTNNYGPYQNKEKLIPKIIFNAINNKKIGIYDKGLQVRDWIHVDDHVSALLKISKKGKIGEKYNIGSNQCITNIKLTMKICKILDNIFKRFQENSFNKLIYFAKDRPGHDWKYSLDTRKINKDLKWKSKITFKKGLNDTIKWYISNNFKIK